MFDGYLELGGSEVLNSARALGYTRTASCGINWLVCPPCDGVSDAIGDEPYTYERIEDAPWYDHEIPASHRFLGAHAISIEGVSDSTREASVAEGILDGGVVGRVREATKRMRVRALLSAQGEDALEYGMSWLDSALRPGKCGIHADSCGASDTRFFVACPPERDSVTIPSTVWNDPITNLVTNPSFEAVSATPVEVRRNLAINPTSAGAAGFTPNSAAWVVTRNSALPLATPDGITVGAKVQNPSTPSNALASVFNLDGLATTNPARWIGAWVLTDQAGMQARIGTASVPPWVPLVQNVWTWVVSPSTIPLNSYSNVFVTTVSGANVNPAGSAWVTGVTAFADGGPSEALWGGKAASGDFTYAWTGAANASASVQNGIEPVTVDGDAYIGARGIQSTDWAASGTKSLRIIPVGNSAPNSAIRVMNHGVFEIGKTYTILTRVRLAAPLTNGGELGGTALARRIRLTGAVNIISDQVPNTAGVHELRWTVPITGAVSAVQLWHGGTPGSPDIWYDDLLIVEGEYSGDYFDGSFPDSEPTTVAGAVVYDYAWTGTANASTSTRRDGSIVYVPDPLAYAIVLERLERSMHSVTCVSGPTVEEKLHRGDAWGYIVEFILVAAVPWVFGATRHIILDISNPIVVQDVPFNLVPYPSAEIPLGTVIAATNFSNNPSVETNLTNWSAAASSVAAQTALTQSDTATGGLASVGTKSARARFTATGAGGPGTIRVDNTSATFAATAAGHRMSVNLWASAIIVSGTAVVASAEIYAIWRAGSTVLRTDLVGAVPAGGGAVTLKSVAVPVGTTNVILRAQANLTSWASGAVVDLYADAAAATVP